MALPGRSLSFGQCVFIAIYLIFYTGPGGATVADTGRLGDVDNCASNHASLGERKEGSEERAAKSMYVRARMDRSKHRDTETRMDARRIAGSREMGYGVSCEEARCGTTALGGRRRAS